MVFPSWSLGTRGRGMESLRDHSHALIAMLRITIRDVPPTIKDVPPDASN